MLGNGHVRFGGRAGETHSVRAEQGAPVRPLHPAPHPRGQAVLRGGAGCLLAPGGRLVHRRHPDRGAGHQRPRDGDPVPPAGCWDADPLRYGVQFTSWAFSQRAKASGLVPSMGGVGACYDNAMIESFWSRMQVELLDRHRWRTRLELANAIFEYLELFHNRQRRHSSLGMLSPIEFENPPTHHRGMKNPVSRLHQTRGRPPPMNPGRFTKSRIGGSRLSIVVAHQLARIGRTSGCHRTLAHGHRTRLTHGSVPVKTFLTGSSAPPARALRTPLHGDPRAPALARLAHPARFTLRAHEDCPLPRFARASRQTLLLGAWHPVHPQPACVELPQSHLSGQPIEPTRTRSHRLKLGSRDRLIPEQGMSCCPLPHGRVRVGHKRGDPCPAGLRITQHKLQLLEAINQPIPAPRGSTRFHPPLMHLQQHLPVRMKKLDNRGLITHGHSMGDVASGHFTAR